MKRILAFILATAVALTCITAPMRKANAANNGDIYTDSRGEYTYKDGYWEQQYGTDEEYGYTKMTLYEQKGDSMWNIGCAWYGKDGTLLFKLVDGEVLIDKRDGRTGGVYIGASGLEYVYKDGYCQRYSGMDEEHSYIKMSVCKEPEDNLYDGFSHMCSSKDNGEIWYDKDGNIVYHLMKTDEPNKYEVLVNNLKMDLRIKCKDEVTAGFKTKAKLICDNYDMPTVNEWEVCPDAEWSSSDTNIATISKDGKITAKKAGMVSITGTVKKNGQKAVKKIKVIKNQCRKVTTYINSEDAVSPLRCKVTRTAWYDESGNLKCKISYKGMEKQGKKILVKVFITNVMLNGKLVRQHPPVSLVLGTQYKITLHEEICVNGKTVKKFKKRVSDIRKGKTVTKTYTIKNAKLVDLTDKRDTATSFSEGINGSDWTVNFNGFSWSTLTSTNRK